MPLDEGALRRGCRGADIETARQLCRAEIERFRAFAASGDPLTVGCTQEAPLFSEVAGEQAAIAFANVRETAGWSADAKSAGPKMAALLAAAAEPMPDVPFVGLASEGVTLIYGRDDSAIEAARLLADRLDVTVMVAQPKGLAPPRTTEFPVVQGTIRSAKGHLGAFELTVDNFAQPDPSSRGELTFSAGRDGAVSQCDVVLDLSGGAPLFPAHDLRDGYLRADPADPAAVLRAVLKARDLTGTFDKPRYVTFTEDLCAHSRSRIVGCRRCLDLCPTGAITPAGDHVAIDPQVCAGCGQCAAACPTGAAAYALPPADALMRKLRVMLSAYREAGGAYPIALLHDEAHGAPLIDALARHGDGLPANVLPLAVNEVTQVGLETVAAAFAYGASALRFLLRARARHDVAGLHKTIALAEPILQGLGFGPGRVAAIETDDPDALGEGLRAVEKAEPAPRPATFSAVGAKRDVMRLSLRELQRASPAPVDIVALPEGAPFGTVEVNVAGCTLCLACVGACPTGALSADSERPMLRFAEDACVQCGLCKATCPEKVITLRPQIDFRAATAAPRTLKEEEPFPCVRCGKPFGVRSTIERVAAKLEGKHWMFKGSAKRLEVIKMCEDCRVTVMSEEDFDPYGAPPRPAPRTTEDYLREREEKAREGES
ncbi:MAG: 4Fe-4S dicluster domain-containing protein [Alphaproteobacteria bacterium]|nr:4Fe-4S dicluster domain-containing protein [Alphaproteobacteria bacterium]